MQYIFRTILFLSSFLISIQLLALNVSPSPSSLVCGTQAVTFTFDCAFTGQVLIANPPSGVNFPNQITTAYIEDVTNGSITFDVEVSLAATSNFNISFIILSSNNNCTQGVQSINATLVNLCDVLVNDDCSGAITLNVSSGSCSFLSFKTTNGNPGYTPSCPPAGYIDLWYSFTANNSTIVLEYSSLPGTLGFAALYNNCPQSGGTEVACSIIVSGNTANVTFNSLTVGNTYLLQMMHLPSSSGTDQQICLHSASPACPTNLFLSDSGPIFPNNSHQASNKIETLGFCTVSSNGITYKSGDSIILGPGFETGTVEFGATIGGCTP